MRSAFISFKISGILEKDGNEYSICDYRNVPL